uniref:Uncharacterized protein n=1 Tax=Rhizophora mucronata TaxID=61149 RepID=A0A2P2KCY3_RHIMU
MYTTDLKTQRHLALTVSKKILLHFFPRSFTPRALSNFPIICWLGMALPDSYSCIIWGFSLITCMNPKTKD